MEEDSNQGKSGGQIGSKQHFLTVQLAFLHQLRLKLLHLQNCVKDTHRLTIDTRKLSGKLSSKQFIKEKQQDCPLRGKEELCTNPKIQHNLQTIQLLVRQTQSTLSQQIFNIKSNLRYSEAAQSNSMALKSKNGRKLNIYSTLSEANQVQQIMISNSYQDSVTTLNQKLVRCEQNVKKVSQKVRKEGKPQQYTDGIKRLPQKDCILQTDKFLCAQKALISRISKYFQLYPMASKAIKSVQKTIAGGPEATLKIRNKNNNLNTTLLSNQKDLQELIEICILQNKTFKEFKKLIDSSKNSCKSDSHLNSQILLQELSRKKIQNNVCLHKNQGNSQRVLRGLQINPLKNIYSVEALRQIKRSLQLHNLRIQASNKCMKQAKQQKIKKQALTYLRQTHYYSILSKLPNYSPQFLKRDPKIDLTGQQYLFLLELESEQLNTKFSQKKISLKWKQSPSSRDFPAQYSYFSKTCSLKMIRTHSAPLLGSKTTQQTMTLQEFKKTIHLSSQEQQKLAHAIKRPAKREKKTEKKCNDKSAWKMKSSQQNQLSTFGSNPTHLK